jgi:enamine deaminase RidA (YjgF/YER057c/UK114 family)
MKKMYREPLPNVTAVGVNWLAGFQFEIKVIARIPQI